jgi:hypothetical protein
MMLLKRRNLKPIPKTISLALLLIGFFTTNLGAQGLLVDGVLAVVGKNIVLKSDLNQAINLCLMFSCISLSKIYKNF